MLSTFNPFKGSNDLTLYGGFATIVVSLVALRKLKKMLFGFVPRNTVLELVIDRKTVIETELDFISKIYFKDRFVVFYEIIEALEIAKDDKNIIGLVLKFKEPSNMSVAQVEELRESLSKFKAAGKKLFAFAESFGEFQNGLKDYYLASVCDRIFIPPSADVNIGKVVVNSPFIRSMLENKLGIRPEIYQRKAYKNAANLFMNEKFTEQHRESTEALVNTLHDIIFPAISASRQISISTLDELSKKLNFSASEALEHKLIDGTAYEYEAFHTILPKFLGVKNFQALNLLFVSNYLEITGRLHGPGLRRSVIALILAEGNIHTGESQTLFETGSTSIGSSTLCRSIREAIDDKKVKAIVLRINSGGGSYIASDMIMNALDDAKKAGKKVIVSFSGVSASGGYFISQHADKIICQPSTITGSIGVFAGKFYIREMWAKLGITFDFILPDDENGTMFSMLHEYNDSQRAKINEMLDRIYADFTNKVAEGRKLSLEHVEKVAQGRVWVGREAKEHGLIDEFGGLMRAIEIAKEECKIKGPFHLKTYPQAKSILQQFRKPKNSQEGKSSLGIFSSFLETIRLVSYLSAFCQSPFFHYFTSHFRQITSPEALESPEIQLH